MIRHAAGVTHFQHAVDGLEQELDVCVAPDDPVKLSLLTLTNTSSATRRLSVFGYVEWVLGPPRAGERRFVVTELDAATGAILARNAYNTGVQRSRRVLARDRAAAVVHLRSRATSSAATARWRRPAALFRERLGGRVGAGLDPCAALQVAIEIPPGESRSVAFVLGQGATRRTRAALAARYRRLGERSTRRSRAVERVLGRHARRVQVHTPDDSFDLLVNRWLLYQTLSCRIWARSGPYQPGGAFGFRDQLQDVLALLYARPDLCRAHLLRAASRQFVEGDVQHWWHPPSRTRHAHALLGRSAVAAVRRRRLRRAHRRRGVLDEVVPFLEAPLLEPRASTRPTCCRRSSTRDGVALRALRPRDRSLAEVRRARAAAHGHGRLERRHESRRARGQRRERLARLVPGHAC